MLNPVEAPRSIVDVSFAATFLNHNLYLFTRYPVFATVSSYIFIGEIENLKVILVFLTI